MRTLALVRLGSAVALLTGFFAACSVDRRGHTEADGGASGGMNRGGSAGASGARGGNAGRAGSNGGSAGGVTAEAGASGEGGAPNPDGVCGDGKLVSSVEDCDDGNGQDGDGCSAACEIEAGYGCTQAAEGEVSTCTPICGDSLRVGNEADAAHCDDGNRTAGDGCADDCTVETGFTCTGAPTVCKATCGDGKVVGSEAQAGGCDDGDKDALDGCNATCTVEIGYVCTGAPSTCAKTCGNGALDAGEKCDDGNTTTGDGCAACAVEPGFTCTGASTCADINECATGGRNDCDVNATCTNTKGSFTCACKAGFSGNGVTCSDVNECTAGTHNCSANATCTNTAGAFTCACKSGFSGNGVTCTDINECSAQPGPCTNTAEVCTNTSGGYTCTCPSGTRLNAGKCMTILQFITGFTPVDVSGDGTVVVGTSGDFPARWSQSDSTVRTLVNDSTATVRAVSSDGHVVIGTLGGTATRWVDLQAGAVLLNSTVVLNVAAVNKDGSVIVGTRSSDNFLFRWKSTGITYFNPASASPDVSNGMTVTAVSDDGNLVVGKFGDPFYDQGYRWNLSTSSADVFKTADPYSSVQPRDISADGTTIVGQLWGANGMLATAGFSWKANTLVKLNSIAQVEQALATNSNGTRAISATTYWPNLSQTSVDLLTYAGSVGGDTSLITAMTASNMSSDGKTIVGTVKTSQGVTRGFILRIP